MAEKHNLTDEQVDEFKEAFSLFDKDVRVNYFLFSNNSNNNNALVLIQQQTCFFNFNENNCKLELEKQIIIIFSSAPICSLFYMCFYSYSLLVAFYVCHCLAQAYHKT